MSEEAFDAIIVGAGPAGATAAYILAKAGADVLVIERGNYAGSKNVTGGRLYAHSLEKIIPDFAQQAPVERKIVKERISFLTQDSGVTLDYQSNNDRPQAASYSVLRAKFDAWLMAQAEAEGAQFISGIRVDSVVMDNGKAVGVEADGDILNANAVILADGVNSILAEKLGMTKRVDKHSVAVGVKELIELPRGQLEDRFNLLNKEGAAWLFAGSPSNGMMGGGFLYTNDSTLSLGLVCGLHDIHNSSKSVPQMLEDFKQHPVIKPLIAGGKMVEYSAHVVPEAGINMMQEIVGEGLLIVGDAAGMCLNLGFTIRGMDLAVASGEAAAHAVLAAKEKNDFSRQGLAQYQELLEQSAIMHDLRLYKKLPAFMENPRLFNQYPEMVAGMMADMFNVDGTPSQPMRKKIMQRCKKIGYWNLIKDGIKGASAI
jgi:electron transfer flavoprotein-quinone oxidoreductase